MKTITVALAVLSACLLLASPGGAQVRYKDDEGTMHWVNSIDEVPQEYRAGAVGGPVPKAKPSDIDWDLRAREIDARAKRVELLQAEAVQQAREERARFLLGCAEKYRMLIESMQRSGTDRVSTDRLVAFVGPRCAAEWGQK